MRKPNFLFPLVFLIGCGGSPATSTPAATAPPPDPACASGLTLCGDQCVDLEKDAHNCGGCDLACPQVPNGRVRCHDSACWLSSCLPGYNECDGNGNNGCETPGPCQSAAPPDPSMEPTPSVEPSMSPVAPPPMMRPLPAETAQLRFLELDLLGSELVGKLCVFGADGDPRPYAVLGDHMHSRSEAQYGVPASYGAVPAGVPLLVQTVWLIQSDLDLTTSSCDVTRADPLPGLRGTASAPLAAAHSYTVASAASGHWSKCTSDATSGCNFYPYAHGDQSFADCAPSGRYLFEDGNRLNGGFTGGLRIVNLTDNASVLSFSFEANSQFPFYHASLGRSENADYAHKAPSSTLRVCPKYLTDCPGESWGSALLGVLVPCTDGSGWQVAGADSARFLDDKLATTVYLVGEGRYLYEGALHGDAAQVVLANDVSDGPLP